MKPNDNVADTEAPCRKEVEDADEEEDEDCSLMKVVDEEEVEDADEEEDEDCSSMDVNNSTTGCCAFIESTCFALALVVIGMIMGTLLPSPTAADAAEVNPTGWQKFSTTHGVPTNGS